ncbi:hypothetical protein [Pseudomaricurvus sp.]|uniref:hypothetical protein n=1 Tax=Pseudomaricurvus sp. TaxID=2004510 RepID=UPI003F6B67FC
MSITSTSWPLSSPASFKRRVEYKLGFLDNMATLIIFSSAIQSEYNNTDTAISRDPNPFWPMITKYLAKAPITLPVTTIVVLNTCRSEYLSL